MSNMNSMEREQKKRQLKRRIVEPGSAPGGRPGKHQEDNEEEIVRKAERKTRLKRLRLILILIMLAAILVFLAVRYVRGHQYMEYTVAWEKEIPASESSFTGYMKFGENLLKYSKDGASYIDKSGNAVWSLSYQMKSPVCYVNGNFAVIGDQQGNSLYICDITGLQGEATTLLPILRVSVSAYGVAAALVEDGDCVYVDSGTTTVGMLKYLQGKRITIVSSSTELLDNLPIKNAKCILLGGEVRDDLESVLGALTEKMISDMYFDKAFIGANGYIPDGGIYTYDDREARKKVIVKDHSKVVYVLMDTSKKNKYAFSKVFELGEAILITEEEDT